MKVKIIYFLVSLNATLSDFTLQIDSKLGVAKSHNFRRFMADEMRKKYAENQSQKHKTLLLERVVKDLEVRLVAQ